MYLLLVHGNITMWLVGTKSDKATQFLKDKSIRHASFVSFDSFSFVCPFDTSFSFSFSDMVKHDQ